MITRRGLFGLGWAGIGLAVTGAVKAEEPLKYWQDDVDWDEVERDYKAMKMEQSTEVEGWYPVEVRWYNEVREYGYVEPISSFRRMFLSGETVRLRGWDTVKPGQKFWVHWAKGPVGRPCVMQIMRWTV